MERVSIIEGETPVILIAPHGPDDLNTDYLAETVAEEFGAFAVINRGWKRSQSVDHWRDFANCNDIRHLHQDVVKEEFLNPILRFSSKIKKKYEDQVLILIIHGCSDSVRVIANDENLDMIVGFGDGDPPSFSCKTRLKNAFVHHLQKEGFGVYEGKPKGNYSGRSKNNLNQLFAQWYPDKMVNSLQIEIVRELREKNLVNVVIDGLINSIDYLMLFDDTISISNETIHKI